MSIIEENCCPSMSICVIVASLCSLASARIIPSLSDNLISNFLIWSVIDCCRLSAASWILLCISFSVCLFLNSICCSIVSVTNALVSSWKHLIISSVVCLLVVRSDDVSAGVSLAGAVAVPASVPPWFG